MQSIRDLLEELDREDERNRTDEPELAEDAVPPLREQWLAILIAALSVCVAFGSLLKWASK